MESIVIFSCKNYRQQEFALSKNCLDYIVEQCNSDILRKFYLTCKFFYIKYPYFIVDKINFDDDNKRRIELENVDDCIDAYESEDMELLDNIWVIQKLKATTGSELDVLLMSKIVRCDARKIYISYMQQFSFDKYLILTQSGKVEELTLCSSPILFSDGSKVPLEKLMECVPNVKNVVINGCHITPQTMNKLILLPFKQKFNEFYITFLDGLIDVELFRKFIKNNVGEEVEVLVPCNHDCGGCFYFEKIRDKFTENQDIGKTNKKAIKSSYQVTQDNQKGFPKPIINYIVKTSSAEIMKKLYQTCKYFYKKSPHIIVDEIIFNIVDGLSIDEYSFQVDDLELINNLWITKKFDCSNYRIFDLIITKISRCDASEISLSECSALSEKNIKDLIKSGKVKICHLHVADDNHILLENILEHLLNVEKFSMYPCQITHKTMPKLISLSWKNKINLISLVIIDKQKFDIKMFVEFLKIAAAPKAKVILTFNELKNDEEARIHFSRSFKRELETWIPKKERPVFNISFMNLF